MIAIGIDVSKAELDIYCSNKGTKILNSKGDIEQFFSPLVGKECKIIIESTGKYHRLVHTTLAEMGFTAMLINPQQSRYFAKSMNILCKTDRVDSKVLAKYAEVMEYKPTILATGHELQMQDLSRHIEDLKQTRIELLARLEGAQFSFIIKSLKRAIKAIDNEISESEEQLEEKISEDESLSKRSALLESIPGIGRKTAVFLLCNLRELGSLNKNQISALAGLAPRNNDSGTFKGKRHVRGGRANIKASLYMPILGAATKHNKRLKAFYKKLVEAGKNKLAALIACMRKLIVWANTILATGQKWQESIASC